MLPPARPLDMYDRDYEWNRLARFIADDTLGATLGVVSGRRRQGKSFLLEALAEATDGFYFAAIEETESEALDRLGAQLGRFRGAGGPIRLPNWTDAVDHLLSLGANREIPVVLDEFPYLCKAQPALPSIIQAAYGPRRRERVASRTRLLLCGSAMSFMGNLLGGAAPLRGRAGLELVVHTFDYRTAADFWQFEDWRLAVKVHAIVGGTPAYRREFVGNDVPRGPDDFDAWVVRSVLDPSAPLLREGRYLLAEEVDLRDRALYHAVLTAVALGHRTPAAIASHLGRPADTLRHAIGVLEDAGFLLVERDPFRTNRSYLRIAEPLINFYHAIVRPEWGRVERPGLAGDVWADSAQRFSAGVVGPHFEHLAREWTLRFASAATLGRPVQSVTTAAVNNPAAKGSWEVDIAAFGISDQGGRALVALGEAKWGEVIGERHIARLADIRDAVSHRGDVDTAETRLLLVSARGFTDEVRRAQPPDVELVDLERLYTGS